jgi:glycosyltransferase involved in cell wall biosynthesis
MRIVIDMQGAQSSGSRNRGIGRYTLALSKEMARLRGEHKVVLVLNGLFPDTIEPIRAAFADLLSEDNIHVWEAPGPVNAAEAAHDARRRAAEQIREAFIACLKPDIVLLTSLFEGSGDDAVTSIGGGACQLPTAVILYDLIPLIHRGIYLQNPPIERWYLNKLEYLRRADMLLSISASTRQEAIVHLDFPPERVVNISTASDGHFRPIALDESRLTHLRTAYGLVRPFVMYTGGIDHRKNIDGLIRGYAKLPRTIRATCQLAVVCSIQPSDRKRLLQLSKKAGLADGELVFTGFVTDEDLLVLYNACKLFVLPSWHEGFGLPVLEAMACGRAVIGSNTSSVPEVIGRDDALFDPFDDDAIARKIENVLTDDAFRAGLEQYGIEQAKKFSWERTAHKALKELDSVVTKRRQRPAASASSRAARRHHLAYVSPLPPEQSGIADYSAELLPELSKHYHIEVIVAQKEVSESCWARSNCPIRSVEWFRANARRFNRVLYHFGNSPIHSHMFDLLGEIPGVVVMHDFFLSGIVAHMDIMGIKPNSWAKILHGAHGWLALQSRFQAKDASEVIYAYPCNLTVVQQSLGVIVHSSHSLCIARQFIGAEAVKDWAQIPLLRVPELKTKSNSARLSQALAGDDFVVCCFGLLGPTKLNHRLIDAWMASPLADDPRCHLIFVGQNHDGEYGKQLVRKIRRSTVAGRIEVTGWTDAENYRRWLTAADIGVQLRTQSRGETSAAVLDCMNHGLATVVNAHGSMADLPADAVWMLPDEFSNEELIEALLTLWQNKARRLALGQYAREVILTNHQPSRCADKYKEAIENFYQNAAQGMPALVDAIATSDPLLQPGDWARMATALANNFPPRPRRRQLLLDISDLVQLDEKNGIQRVVRALLKEFLLEPPEGWAVEPVYGTSDTSGYCYARRFASRFLGVYDGWTEDEPVEAWPGDIFLGLGSQNMEVSAKSEYLLSWHRRGIKVFFIVYDLLPILIPNAFPEIANGIRQRWLAAISQFDGALCVSRAVADELQNWLQNFGPERARPFSLRWFHPGADLGNPVLSRGRHEDADRLFEAMNFRPSFLMVDSIESHKGHAQTIAAFELLWKQGMNPILVLVGNEGLMVESMVKYLRTHPERNKNLFWTEGISDEYLEEIYVASTCLIAASEGEGFGLPLIEAALHKLPIIARDIPVFREVAGEYAYYFDGKAPEDLAQSIAKWLQLHEAGHHPTTENMPRLTCKESAAHLMQILLEGRKQARVCPEFIPVKESE